MLFEAVGLFALKAIVFVCVAFVVVFAVVFIVEWCLDRYEEGMERDEE